MPLHDPKKVTPCEAITEKGKHCKNPKMLYSSYCKNHQTFLDRMDKFKVTSDNSLFESLYGNIEDKNRLDAVIAARKRQESTNDLSDIRALLLTKILEIEASDMALLYKGRELSHLSETLRRVIETDARIKETPSGKNTIDFSRFWKDPKYEQLAKKKGKPIQIDVN